MSRRVPQTDPWREPPKPPRGRRVVLAFIWVALVVLAVLLVIALAGCGSDGDGPAIGAPRAAATTHGADAGAADVLGRARPAAARDW